MARTERVDTLFNLPFFKKALVQMVEPIQQSMFQIAGESLEDAESISRACAEVNKFVFDGVMSLQKAMYVEKFSDDEINELITIYGHPVMLKTLIAAQELMPKMVSWFGENEDRVRELIEAGIEAEEKALAEA